MLGREKDQGIGKDRHQGDTSVGVGQKPMLRPKLWALSSGRFIPVPFTGWKGKGAGLDIPVFFLIKGG